MRYWPEETEGVKEYKAYRAEMSITLVKTTQFTDYDLREFVLSRRELLVTFIRFQKLILSVQ